jgi:hypothetical protein
VVLTVGGMIGKTNRGPLDAKRDSLLALQKIDSKDAFAFDRAMLLSLPQGTVTAQPTRVRQACYLQRPLAARSARLSRGGAGQDHVRRGQRLYGLA